MKHIKHWLATMAVLLCGITASAHDFEVGGIWYNITSESDKTAEVTYKGNYLSEFEGEYFGPITIPATVTHNGVAYSVTSIGNEAFFFCDGLTAITLPESVTSIGRGAFFLCSTLTAITLPEGVTSIGESTFYECGGLQSITLPASLTSIESSAFQNCSSLTEITIPEGVTSIGDWAFDGCSSLTAITIPASVTSIGEDAFRACYYLSAVLVSSIEAWCQISFGDGFSTPFRYASSLYLNKKLVTELVIPVGVTSIGDGTFGPCSFTTITFPASVTSIGNGAFLNGAGLTAITCEATTPPIINGSYNFQNVDKSIPVYVPAGSVEAYKVAEGWSEFTNIVGMSVPITHITLSQSSATLLVEESLTLTATVAPDNATDKTLTWSSSNPSVATVDNMGKVTAIASGTATIAAIANDGSGVSAQCEVTVTRTAKVEISGIWYNLVSKTKQAEVTFKGYNYSDCYDEYSGSITIPATVTHNGVEYSVTSIGDYAFFNNNYLTDVTIPKGVMSIGDCAFQYCSDVFTAVIIPESVTSIGYQAFFNCNGLTTITLPEGVVCIGDDAFSGCHNLVSITFPKSVMSIGKNVLSCCPFLTSITVNKGNMVYDSRESCNAIIETRTSTLISGCTTTIIPRGITCIGDNAFDYCISLTAITLPEGVTSIGNCAFIGCSSLTAITLPESVTNIGYQAFDGCSGLTAITLPEGVTSIEWGAFQNCHSLTDINIPGSVTSIGSGAFSFCSSLTSIAFPANVTNIENGVFYECSSLTSITIPDGVTSIGGNAFYECRSLTTIILPKNLQRIDFAAFGNCVELLDVYCSAETVPSTEADAFEGSYIEHATLHVPAVALNDYKSTAPWNSFGTINSATNEPVQSITLNRQSATMTEGNTLTLTATITPIYATDRTLTWSSSNPSVATVDNTGKVTAIAPGTATIIAAANDGSGVSASCEVTVTEATYVEITINQYGSGTYCSEYALDFSEVEGLKAYAATGYDSETGIVTLTRVMTSQPGMGLFIKGEPGEYIVPTLESTSFNTLNMLVGTLENTDLNGISADGLYANYKYTVKEGDAEPVFYQFADGSTLAAGRAYLQIPTAWLTSATAKSISYRFDDGETTDIEDIESGIQNSELIYDLMGRRVQTPSKGSVYIVNGKKIVY